MTLAQNLQKAARNLIDTFGNTANIYTYSSATKTENEEGDVTVSNWGTPASVKIVDGANIREVLSKVGQGIETVGEDDRIVRDDVTISTRDRLTEDSVEYEVVEIAPILSQNTIILKNIRVTRVTGTSTWA